MPIHLRFVISNAIVFLVMIFAGTLSADIILSNADGGSNFDTGAPGAGKLLQVYIGEDAGSTDSIFAIAADFEVQGALVQGGEVSITGTTGTPGFFAAGDLDTSTFTPTQSMDGFNVNQLTTSGAHRLLNSPNREKWFELELNTTGLADGTYTIRLFNPDDAFGDPALNPISTNNDLTFTVGAVPEPNSMILVGLAGCVCVIRRRRHNTM